MLSRLVLLLLAACASPVAAVDGDVAEAGLMILAILLLLLVVIVLTILFCVCCRCCRACQAMSVCRPFDYDGGEKSRARHYAPRTYDRGYTYTYRDDYRTRHSPERPWEGRGEHFDYAEGYEPRYAQRDPRDPERAVVVVKDLGYPPRPAIQNGVVSSELQPGQIVVGPQYPMRGPQAVTQSQKISADELRSKPWFGEVQQIINTQ